MEIMHLVDSVEGPKLVAGNAPRPQPGPGELLIRVCAVGVTPTEVLWYPTFHTKTGEKRINPVPGHEFSGVVAVVGGNVSGFYPGQEVYGMSDWFLDGAMAEYCITSLSAVAPKPSRLTHVEAASVPISALTAWQGLFERAKLQPGERVLIQGGAGAVGVFAVQLARNREAHVIATASAQNVEFVSQLGAEQVIDYRASRFENSIAGVDVVFDTVGGETLQRSWAVLKPGGRMVTIAATAENETDERTKKAFFIVEPNQQQLTEVGDLLQTRRIRPVVDAVIPFALADMAYRGKAPDRSGRGKLVVTVADPCIEERTEDYR